jgi:hypothetical protein
MFMIAGCKSFYTICFKSSKLSHTLLLVLHTGNVTGVWEGIRWVELFPGFRGFTIRHNTTGASGRFISALGLRSRGRQLSRQVVQLGLMRLSVLCLAAMIYMMDDGASVTVMGR